MKMKLFYTLFFLSIFPSLGTALPSQIDAQGEKVIIVDPQAHRWGAYGPSGNLIRSGVAASGANYCKDMGQPCRTQTGEFRIRTLGGPSCKSPSFPMPNGGSPMPYCMYFNETQALHGSYHVASSNISHGCVRMYPSDARWMRYNFATIGTKVIILSY